MNFLNSYSVSTHTCFLILPAWQGAKPLSVRLAPDNFTAQGSVWCGGSFRGRCHVYFGQVTVDGSEILQIRSAW